MLHPIEPHAGWKVNLAAPQQRWTFTDNSGLMATARFAGHFVEAITDDAGGFYLMYLGSRAKSFAGLPRKPRRLRRSLHFVSCSV